MNLDLTDEETAACREGTVSLSASEREAVIRELRRIIQVDRYRLSPRSRALRDILGKLAAQPVREPLPPPRHYEPPRAKGRGRG
jgi:hypothetical protein